MEVFKDIRVDESNILQWHGLVVPVSVCTGLCMARAGQMRVLFQANPPYNHGAFRVEIIFPAEYPFKPPKITFKTKIYHPNIDEKGQVCLPIISPENWKPATKTDQGMGRMSGV